MKQERKTPMKLVFMLAVVGSLGVGCASSTQFVQSWASPDAKPLAFTKVIAIGVDANEGSRRIAEEEICKSIKNPAVVCIPSWSVLPGEAARDTDTAKAKIQEQRFDGAVILRVLGIDKEVIETPATTTVGIGFYQPPGFYHPMYGYYGTSWGMAYRPGSTRVRRTVRVETNIYSVRDEKLVWSGVSETVNPDNTASMVAAIAGKAGWILRREGLVGPG